MISAGCIGHRQQDAKAERQISSGLELVSILQAKAVKASPDQ